MRNFYAFIALLAFNILGFKSNAQTVFVTVSNQGFVGTDFFFDLNIATASGTLYIGDCDFSFPFNSANFAANCVLSRVVGTSNLVNNGGSAVAYVPATTKTNNGTVLTINIQGPGPVDQPDFDSRVAAVGTTPTRISRFKLSLISNPSGFSGLTCGTMNINGYDITDLATPYMENLKSTTCTTPASVALPLTLLNFTGKAQTENNALNWITADEKNFSRFVVQSSSNGESFKTLGEVKGLGNASTTQKYAFNDDAPAAISYYRLAMIDIDGKTEYSNVISLNRNEPKLNVLRAYPSPIENILTVDFIAPKVNATQLIISDALGRVIQTNSKESQAGFNTTNIDVSSLASGVYFLTLNDGESQQVQKIVKR